MKEDEQQAVRSDVEALVVWLRAARPLGHIANLQKHTWQRNLVRIGVIEFLLVIVVSLPLSLCHLDGDLMRLQLFVVFLSLAAMPLILRLCGPATMAWLIREASPWRIVGRFLLLLVVGFVVLGLYQLGLLHLMGHASSADSLLLAPEESPMFYWGILVVWMPFTWFWIVTQAGALALWFMFFVWLLHVANGVTVRWLARALERNELNGFSTRQLTWVGLTIMRFIQKREASHSTA